MRKFLHFLLWFTLITAAIVGILRLVAIRFFVVPDDLILSASVNPTLQGGDLVVLWRLTPPAHGDLVACPEPDNPGQWVVGRLLAEEGDTVVVQGNSVVVNGTATETEMACDDVITIDPNTEAEVEQKCSIEVAGTHKHQIAQAAGHKNVPRPVKDELMSGEVFLVSDNRLYPYDSRHYGPVQRENCKETVMFRLVGPDGWSDAERRLTFIR